MITPAWIGLGSNLGDREAHLDAALAALAEAPGIEVRAISSYRETEPVGGPGGQGAFLNAAASVATTLDPHGLLRVLQAIERREGRVRSVRWGERTLDLDLLLFGDRIIDSPGLQVPHPRMTLRRFVLAPLAEIAPGVVEPWTGRTVAESLAHLDRRPSYVALSETSDPLLPEDPRASGHPSLFPHVVRALSAVTLEDRVLPHARPSPQVCPRPPSGIDLDPRVAEMAMGLDLEAWSDPTWGERWLVTPFWLDQFYLALNRPGSARPRLLALKERFLEMRSRVIPPTFVVIPRHMARQMRLRDPRLAWQRPIGWDTPILELETDDLPTALAEVLAACTATRTGS